MDHDAGRRGRRDPEGSPEEGGVAETGRHRRVAGGGRVAAAVAEVQGASFIDLQNTETRAD